MKEIKLSNKVIITDPCYGIQDYPNPHTKLVLDNVKAGTYQTNIHYSDESGWGNRVAALEIIHADYNPFNDSIEVVNLDLVECIGSVCVDSGQMGIYDYDYYKSVSNDDGVDDNWYDEICKLTLSQEMSGTKDNLCVVSRTGYGDGDYNVYIGTVNGEVAYIGIIFIDDELDEFLDDEEDEEFEFDELEEEEE